MENAAPAYKSLFSSIAQGVINSHFCLSLGQLPHMAEREGANSKRRKYQPQQCFKEKAGSNSGNTERMCL